ncbi:MAG: acyl-protein synthetase [Oscillospiraceae bacterium]|jgi:phenylacetate-coenzyme A ligase PaaK-like adenylate-forming protein|nr:acyl-protein synthetase [Oscillospiraceae bacterium]
MGVGWRLFYRRGLYDLSGTQALFFQAMTENVRHHMACCPDYAAILRHCGFSPDDLHTPDDLYKIPPLPTLLLKRRALYSAPPERLLFRSTTSGTSGAVSEMGLDLPSAARGFGMVLTTLLTHRILSPRPADFVVLGYQPTRRNRIGAVKTAYAMTFTAPSLHRVYALRDTGDTYALNFDEIRAALLRCERRRRPVRFIGFPAYFFFFLQTLAREGVQLRLHPKSRVFLAGGWKQFFAEQVDRPALCALSARVLGLGDAYIREFFGAVEHPIAYFDCPNHHFHVPIYTRVLIRDVSTLAPVGYGTPGLLNLLTPMITSMPFASILTDDLAVLRAGSSCGCGISSPYFDVLGRVGLSDIKTCAASAAELLADLGKGGHL